jgi:hypothetical protein
MPSQMYTKKRILKIGFQLAKLIIFLWLGVTQNRKGKMHVYKQNSPLKPLSHWKERSDSVVKTNWQMLQAPDALCHGGGTLASPSLPSQNAHSDTFSWGQAVRYRVTVSLDSTAYQVTVRRAVRARPL